MTNLEKEMLDTLKAIDSILSARASSGTRAKPTVAELNTILANVRAAISKAKVVAMWEGAQDADAPREGAA
jgi:hypothetical protein